MGSRNTLELNIAYDQVCKTAVVSPAANQQLLLYYAKVQNQSGSTCDLALLSKLSTNATKFGIYTSPGPIVDATAAINAGTAENIFTTSNNDGFLIQSTKPFNLIGLTLSQGDTGSPVYSFKYYNGTSYVALPTIYATPSFTSTGDVVLLFPSPRDWVKGSTGGVGGTSTNYSILVQASTAPGQLVKATAFWAGQLIDYAAAVPNNGYMDVQFEYEHPKVFDGLEGVLPYFATAGSSNNVTIQYFSNQ